MMMMMVPQYSFSFLVDVHAYQSLEHDSSVSICSASPPGDPFRVSEIATRRVSLRRPSCRLPRWPPGSDPTGLKAKGREPAMADHETGGLVRHLTSMSLENTTR